jgi:AmiR/NasT family two-component response regulator
LDSQPVIEQARGIVMAQAGCGPDKALALLRRAARQAQVDVATLATELVWRTAKTTKQDPSPM